MGFMHETRTEPIMVEPEPTGGVMNRPIVIRPPAALFHDTNDVLAETGGIAFWGERTTIVDPGDEERPLVVSLVSDGRADGGPLTPVVVWPDLAVAEEVARLVADGGGQVLWSERGQALVVQADEILLVEATPEGTLVAQRRGGRWVVGKEAEQ